MTTTTSLDHGRPRCRSAPRRRVPLLAALLALALAVSAAGCAPAARRSGGKASGLWISPAELMARPTGGGAWENVRNEAYANWGHPSLSDNQAHHDTSTLAGALVAVRTGDEALKQKTRAAIMSVTRVTQFARVLEMSRNITSYVIAADLVGLAERDDAAFRYFIAGLRHRRLEGHSGGTDLTSTALRSPNNWGTMARAAVTAIDLYLGDRGHLNPVVDAHRAWLGEAAPNQLQYSDTRWHASGQKAGINRRGATLAGLSIDGVLPEDQRREGEPTSRAAAKGSYPWEALQGAVVTGVLLDRAGLVSILAGNLALNRATYWLTNTNGNPADGDDTWQPWVLNRVAGTRLATAPARSPGKNMGWTDWTHGLQV